MANLAKTLTSESKGLKPEMAPQTPYSKAKGGWDDRLGSRVQQAANWRLAFLFSSAIALTSIVGLVIVASKPPLPPYVIEVDRISGAANVVGSLNEKQYEPQKAEIEHFVGQFIKLIRPIPIDPVVIKKNWGEARYFMRQSASNEVEDYARGDGHHDKIGNEALSVEITSISYVSGSNSYQARWKETIYGPDGIVKDAYTMLGVFTIELDPPKDEKALFINPLGVYIKHIQWMKEVSNAPAK